MTPGTLAYLVAAAAVAAAAVTAGIARAEPAPPPSADVRDARQSLDDAWWTGPMLANTPATAVPGHMLVETYVYDVATDGRFDRDGARRGAPYANGFGTQTYLVYGVADRTALGLIPTAGFDTARGAPSSAGLGAGDISLLAQYQLTQFHLGSWLPTTAVNVEETFPTGKYDRLGDRPNDGIGSGAYTTTLSLYSQTYFWLPNGRILRTRFDVSQSLASAVNLAGVSVYGTPAGFRGGARPGSSLFVDSSWEISLTRSWVLATDLIFRHTANTRVSGDDTADPLGLPGPPAALRMSTGASDSWGLAPAVEYSWRPDLGVLLGARFLVAGRNTPATISPAVAINYVH
jgi:hypothetical protein